MRALFILPVIVLASCFQRSAGQPVHQIFLTGQPPKSAMIPQYRNMEKPSPSAPAEYIISIDVYDTITRVSNCIYGTNANIYSGTLNKEEKLVDYISRLAPHVIRYPGGLNSNEYFWNVEKTWSDSAHDFIFLNLPSDLPEKLTASDGSQYDPWWVPGRGGWEFGLDDYYDFLERTGSEGIITVNYSYARYGTGPAPVQTAARLAADWVRYDNGRTRYWEVGNENVNPWASGYRIDTSLNRDGQPQILTSELYGKHFKVFADSMKAAAEEIGTEIYIGAQYEGDFFLTAGNTADFLIVHDYFTPYAQNSGINVILNSVEPAISEQVKKIEAAIDQYGVKNKPVAMTEWNIFAEGSGQASSYINGLHAVLVLGESVRNHWGMSNRWDLANGWDPQGDDMGMFSRGDDPDGIQAKWNPRPPFYYMYFFRRFFGDYVIQSNITGDDKLTAYASLFSSGEAGIVVVNRSDSEHTVELDLNHFNYGERYYFYSLTGGNDNGDFSRQVYVNGYGPENTTIGGPVDSLEYIKSYSANIGGLIKFISPGYSVQYVLIETGDHKIIKVDKISVRSEDGSDSIVTDKGTLRMYAEIKPDDASEKKVTWSIQENNNRATISDDGILQALTDGMVTVRATANDGTGIYGEMSIRLKNQIPLALENTTGGSMIVYPNPTSRELHFGFSGKLPWLRIGIYDIRGRMIRNLGPAPDLHSIDISWLNPGVYIIKIIDSEDHIITERFIKGY